jgi:hypothetical protein
MIPTQAEYEAREANEAHRRTMEIERAPLKDRKEARAEWLEAMRDPSLVAERISWLIDGNYGYGQMQQAKRVIANKRLNREAALCQLIARYEWMCPGNFAADAWKSLSKAEQAALSVAIAKEISDAEAEAHATS